MYSRAIVRSRCRRVAPPFPLLQVFCCSYSRPLFLPLLPSRHILLLFPDRAMLVGQACQDVPRTRYSLFFFVSLCLLVFPSCLFSLSRVKNGRCFWGHGHLWQFLTLSPPSCPCLDCGGVGGPGMDLHSLHSLLHDGLGRASGREGGWTLCCLCPTRPHPSPF